MEDLSITQICIIAVMLVMVTLVPHPKVYATPATDCALPATFSKDYLANAKTSLSNAGYSPDFASTSNQAMLAKLEGGAIAFYMAETEIAINLENPTLYSMQPKVAGVGGYGYRVILQPDGTANAGPARFYVSSSGANQSGLSCVQGIKNMTLTAPTVTESQQKFPYSGTPSYAFGNATFMPDPNAPPPPPPVNQELTLRDEKIIALVFSIWLAVVCLRPFVWRTPHD